MSIPNNTVINEPDVQNVRAGATPPPPLPPMIVEVLSGWSVEFGRPKIRVLLDHHETMTAPNVDRFVLGPGVNDFGPVTSTPMGGAVKVYKQTAVTIAAGGLYSALGALDRVVKSVGEVTTNLVQIQNGLTIALGYSVRSETKPDHFERLVTKPPGVFSVLGTDVYSIHGDDVTYACTWDGPTGMFIIDRSAAGIAPGATVVLITTTQEVEVEPALWSVYAMPITTVDTILDQAELPLTTLVMDRVGAAGILEYEFLVPAGSEGTWNGVNIAVGVAEYRDSDEEASRSLITWIPITTVTRPPGLLVTGIGTDFVQFGVTQPVGLRRVGAMVYRFPATSDVEVEGVPLNRTPIGGAAFTDGAGDPNRLSPNPPESGPPYVAPGENWGYVASEMVDTPFPVTALKRIARKNVTVLPFTNFPNYGQQELIH